MVHVCSWGGWAHPAEPWEPSCCRLVLTRLHSRRRRRRRGKEESRKDGLIYSSLLSKTPFEAAASEGLNLVIACISEIGCMMHLHLCLPSEGQCPRNTILDECPNEMKLFRRYWRHLLCLVPPPHYATHICLITRRYRNYYFSAENITRRDV